MSIKQEALPFPSRLQMRAAAAAGPLLMLSSAFLFAVLDGLIKSLGPSYRVWDIAFYRFGGSIAVLFLLFGRKGSLLASSNPKLMILRGVSGSLAFLLEVLAIRMIPVSTALVLFYAFPAFAALFSALLFKERIDKELGWVLSALCGVAVFFDFRLEGGLLGQSLAVLGAAFGGLAVSSIKKLRDTNGSATIYLYFCLTGSLMSFVPFVSNPKLPASANEWLMVGGIVGLSTAGQLLMTQGFRYCRSWEGGLFMTSEVVLVSVWGIFFLSEAITWHFWVGGAMILGSIAALNYCNARNAAPFTAARARDWYSDA